MDIFVIGRFNEFGGSNVAVKLDKNKAIDIALDLVEEMEDDYDGETMNYIDSDNPKIYKLWSFSEYAEEGVFIEKFSE